MGYIEEITEVLVPCLRQAGAPTEEEAYPRQRLTEEKGRVVLDLFAGLPAEASA